MNVSSCRCCMFVSCVHPVAVLNAAFCMTWGGGGGGGNMTNKVLCGGNQ